MKTLLVILGFLIPLSTFGGELRLKPKPQKPQTKRAYFVFRDVDRNEFVIMLKDPAQIRHARALLTGRTTERPHVSGIIVKKRAPYNPRWRYHLAPDSIEFFDFAIEVCDATILYVQQHLSEVGGEFLPGNRWCPWSSELVREIHRRDAKR